MNQPHLITAEDIEGLDMAEIFMEAKGVISPGDSVEIEGWGTYSYSEVCEELSNMGH